MEFSELQKIAQDTLNERRLSRLATAGTVAAARSFTIARGYS